MKNIQLKEIASVFNGKTPSKAQKKMQGYPVLKIKDVSDNRQFKGQFDSFVNSEFAEKFKSKQIKLNDTLILNAAHNADYVGNKVYKAESEVSGSLATGEWLIIRANNIDLDPNYVHYWVLSGKTKHNLKRLVKGIHLYPRDVATLKIPLPPIAEQRRIAAILDKADEIRRKRSHAIKLTEDLGRSLFLDMFGDPVTNPKGWRSKPLGEIGVVQGGLQVTRKRAPNPIEVPYLRVANVYRDSLDLTEIKTIKVTDSELNRTLLDTGDILIVEGHGNNQEIGRSSVWDGSVKNCVHQNHLIRVRIDRSQANPIYISNFLNSSGGRRQLMKFGKTTSGLNTISASNVKATNVLLPPLEEQHQYISIKKSIESNLKKARLYLRESEHLFNSLLQRAFRGEL